LKAELLALILQIATLEDVPPYLMVAIAEVESAWDINAVNKNKDGTTDIGLMQLNSSWYTGNHLDLSEHITEACRHIKKPRIKYNMNWWQATISYNCGVTWWLERVRQPPQHSIAYANKVFMTWESYDKSQKFYLFN
jgi:hypothetical protein